MIMEDREKQHIFRNLTELVDNTIWNTSCLMVAIENSVLSQDDIAFLTSIADHRMRVLEFYRIFMTKHNSYQHLITALEKGRQIAAVKILCELDPIKYFSQQKQQMTSSLSSGTDEQSQIKQQQIAASCGVEFVEREKEHILRNLTELVDKTIWNTACLSVPLQNGVFSNDDSAILEAISNLRERVLEFYQIFLTKDNFYAHLIATLEAGCQSGAVKILWKLDPTKYSLQLSTPTERSFSQLEHQMSLCLSSEGSKNLGTIQQPPTGSSTSQSSSSFQFDVQNPVLLFTGRTRELAILHEKMQQSRTKPTVISQTASIVGLGGIGKTELARMYIQKYAPVYDNNVIWISSETEEILKESFKRLAVDRLNISLLNMDGKEKHMKPIIEEVYTFFNGKQCLFVFDNAETNTGIQNFLPFQVATSPYVLITSRDTDWSFDVEMLELHEMDELEAISFVMKGLQIQNEGHADIVTDLVKTLQCFPLALSQAISYIKQKQKLYTYTITQYVNEYKSHSAKLLNFDARSGPLNTYTKTTFTTWKLTKEFIFSNEDCGKEAMRMLNMISYFQPDKIPTKLLLYENSKGVIQETVPGTENTNSSSPLLPDEKNEKALYLLVKFSMINIQPTDETISIHRLVQEVMRIELVEKNLEETTLENALRLLSKNIELKTINHFSSVYKYCEAYKKLVVDFKHVPSKVMDILYDDKKSSRCLEVRIGYEMKDTLQKHVSSEDADVVRLEFWIGIANYRVGNFEIAAKSFKQILPTYIANKDDKFSKTEILNLQHFLALCLKELGNRTESLKQFLQIYESAKTLHGVNYWWTTQVLVQIAECLQTLGHFKKPLAENTENIQVSTQEFILRDLQTTFSLLKAAYENHRHLISIDIKHARNLFRIANFFKDMGDADTASLIATDGYELGRLSNDIMVQIESVKCLNVLGALKENEGKFEEALEIFREAHAFSSKTLGDSHLTTLLYEVNMLEMLGYVGKGETALSGLRDVLETLVTSYPNHPYLFSTEMSIGITLFNMKNHYESFVLFVDLRKRLEERFGYAYRLMPQVNNWIQKLQNVVP